QTLLLMPAWDAGRSVGVKMVTITPGNGARGLPAVQGIYLLLDGLTGAPKALMEGKQFTVRRTAAASALAAKYCARPDSASHLMVGTGALSQPLIEAHRAVHRITRSRICGRDFAKTEIYAGKLSRLGLKVEPVRDLEAAVREADIISCATLSTE